MKEVELCELRIPHQVRFQVPGSYANPYLDVDASIEVTAPNGSVTRIPAYWAGGQEWGARFAPSTLGCHDYRVAVSGGGPPSPPSGQLEVTPYEGSNELYTHGSITISADKRHLCHQDGKPFFWLRDTWWYGAAGRCHWPEDFQLLVEDRVDKGFTVIQMVVGIPPEIEAADPSAANEGGFPFLSNWDQVNPAYFDCVDKRVEYLVEAGLVPCIVGGWGHHIDWLGSRAMIRYWEYLVARYGAFPVIWCLSGETDLYPGQGASLLARATSRLVPSRIRRTRAWGWLKSKLVPVIYAAQVESLRERKRQWELVGEAVARANIAQHIVTTHPVPGGYAHNVVNNAPWLTLTSIQSGHSEQVASQMVNAILLAGHEEPKRPIVNMEPWYEGMLGRFWEERQRYAFWMCMLAGAAGHTYGANGLWQMSTADDDFLGHWGRADWRAAYGFPGSTQLGAARDFLGALRWWELEPRIDWITPRWGARGETWPLAAAIGTELVLVYFPATKRSFKATLRNLEAGRVYRYSWFDTRSGAVLGARSFTAEETWAVPPRPCLDDWLLVVERAEPSAALGIND